ncbi:tetraprenyl-beta-curcumene synthase family protein [Effusibacillus lacus]|uniref:Tetraprenyl-beta-curcumene synthase n=1 Tax=Effusibacillus lacus TaxID=1348429 RepID=A0A292YRS0_9BACL|nr:tetraprenyl-beta-curcumene synthase family protein [Effusibacillus lacus]TCS76843.1 tetraprenyl-beta-curcumene synthase [Effusibacillus lacus]GAX91175.1 tetraprenyl-beta-curcumene synthase [Effusibacillus lacus]
MKLSTWKFLFQIQNRILPVVHKELDFWKQQALRIPDPELRHQALESIRNKTFHCEGGSIYAVTTTAAESLIQLIAAFQTISDYLDNLCDRSTSLDPEDFHCLHQSMLDAVSLMTPLHDYYQVRRLSGEPCEDDGYLEKLVRTCRKQISKLPNYHLVEGQIFEWVSLYRDLQVHKHVHPKDREQRLIQWWEAHQSRFPELRWYEFAAATGSTLGIFALFSVAAQASAAKDSISRLQQAYFPWIAATHILLDYLVDYEEDQIGGDLNFVAYYSSQEEASKRLHWIAERSRQEAGLMFDLSPIHSIAVDGLLGLYLSDGKVKRHSSIRQIAKSLLRESSIRSKIFYLYSKWIRGKEVRMQLPRV